jgi:hypothetical protein
VRLAAAVAAGIVLSGCAAGSAQKAKVAAHDDLSAIQAVQRTARNRSGAPVNVVFVSGTITNTGSSAMSCSASAFLLVAPNGNAVSPTAQWCDVPSISPKQSAFFNATFAAGSTDNLQLRFVHPDGSYEVHDLILPPA